MPNQPHKQPELSISDIRDLRLAPDPEALQFINPKTQKISLGAMKTEIDRRFIKILRMLGQSCNIKSHKQATTNFNSSLNNPIDSQAVISSLSFDINKKSESSKAISMFEPNDLERDGSECGSNESITKKTIEEMSIYKIFGFKNSSNNEDIDLDNIFIEEEIDNKLNQAVLNIEVEGGLQNITNKKGNRLSNTDRQFKKTILNSDRTQKHESKSKKKCEKQNSQAKQPNIQKRLFSFQKKDGINKCKISIKNVLQLNGCDTGNRNSCLNSPLRRAQPGKSFMLTSRSSAKGANRFSTQKKQNISRSPIVRSQTLEKMREIVTVNDKKMRKESVDNNVRVNMLKRIANKHSQLIKGVNCP